MRRVRGTGGYGDRSIRITIPLLNTKTFQKPLQRYIAGPMYHQNNDSREGAASDVL